jgi:hypothetical protein
MPCHVDTSFEDGQDANHMGRGADALCEFMREIEESYGPAGLPKFCSRKMLRWFEEHKQRDAARENGTSHTLDWLLDENAPWRKR